jgi:hypothetical protein
MSSLLSGVTGVNVTGLPFKAFLNCGTDGTSLAHISNTFPPLHFGKRFNC